MKKFLFTLFVIFSLFFSISVVNVSATSEYSSNYIISSKTTVTSDLEYLGVNPDEVDQNMQVITFASGLKENTKSTMQLYVFFSFTEDFTNKDVLMVGTSFTDGVTSFKDQFSFVAKEGNLYKYEFSRNHNLYSLKSIIKKETKYEFNIDSLKIDGFTYDETNGGYFEQRFQIERVDMGNNIFSYYVKSIDNRYVKVDADVGIRRISGEKNFFTGLIGQEEYDLFYICFDVFVNENKVIYDIFKVDLEYDVEYVKRVQNVESWDDPVHLSTSKKVISSQHITESVISETKTFSFAKYKWFDHFDSSTTVSVGLNTLCTSKYASENGYFTTDFTTDKSYVLFFGDTNNGYKYEKGTIYYDYNCDYHFDLDVMTAANNTICQHLDVYNYEPKNVEFVEIYYRVNGFEYSVSVDETFATYSPANPGGPGTSTETNWPDWMPDWLIWLLEDPEEFFSSMWNWFVENIGIYLLIVLIVAIVCVAFYYFSPILVPFTKIVLNGIVAIICFPFKLIARIINSAKKKE